MADGENQIKLVESAAEVVSAYVRSNSVPIADLPALLHSVHGALSALGQPAPAPVTERPKPHMPIKRTVTDDHIISLEDGKPYRTLKRHLRKHGLTPEQYRSRWSLPSDYPMVAPSYTRNRTKLAKESGLGQKRRGTALLAPKGALKLAGT